MIPEENEEQMIPEELKAAKKSFKEQFSEFIADLSIIGVGIGWGYEEEAQPVGLMVLINKDRPSVLDRMPETFEGYPVYTRLAGIPVAY